jgi:ABC-type uncharacterized transport system substrate-binding protein
MKKEEGFRKFYSGEISEDAEGSGLTNLDRAIAPPGRIMKSSGGRRKENRIITVAVIVLIIMVLISSTILFDRYFREDDVKYPMEPIAKGEGTRWRIGYYQGGDYIDYSQNLYYMIDSLIEMGWMDFDDLGEFKDTEVTKPLWTNISRTSRSNYIEFVEDAFWDSGWNDSLRISAREDCIGRLSTKGDIDLIIAMGTWAGLDLVNDEHSIPTMALTSSDPIGAGIIPSSEDSGFDHVICECDPDRYYRQITLFHEIVEYDSLGVVFEDSPEGRIYGNVKDLRRASEKIGFDLVEVIRDDSPENETMAKENIISGYDELSKSVEAVWCGQQFGEQPQFMPEVLKPLFDRNIRTWGSLGYDSVKRGVLMGAQQHNYAEAGEWYARTLAKILNGALPGNLKQVFELPLDILINMKTAEIIGYEVPSGIEEIAEVKFSTIEGFEE